MPHQTHLTLTTRPRATLDITADVAAAVRASGLRCGLAHVFVQHTSCSLMITENADPDVRRDLLGAIERIVPRDYPYRHAEGNSPAHLMTMLTGSSATVLVHRGRLRLGTWQRIFLCEYDGPRDRTVWWHVLAG